MIFGSVPRDRQSQRPCGPLGRRPLEAADPRPRHPVGAVKRKLQPAARPDDHRVDLARHRRLDVGVNPVDLGPFGADGALNLLGEEVPVVDEMIESTTRAPSLRTPMSQGASRGRELAVPLPPEQPPPPIGPPPGPPTFS
jgi:hypothetical protein